jgi:DNA-binding MarR family transcriptional regulator
METVREQLQLFTRRFGLLNASCCDECCGEQVSLAQSHVLFEVRRAGSPSMQRVAEELGMDITTFSRQVKGLEKKGLVVRSVSTGDRRVSLLALTGEGLHMLEKIDRYMSGRLERVFAGMSDFERETVVRSLGVLNEAIIQAAREASGREGTIACCK